MENTIENLLECLVDACLDNADEYQGYTDKELVGATMVFSHFLLDATFKENKKLSEEDMLELADTTGKAIREIILSTTGKDMHELVKSNL